MQHPRLSPRQLADHLGVCEAGAARVARALRATVLGTAPAAREAIRFGALCYFVPGVPFGSIGGNICMIEVKDGRVRLSFIHGASLPDPAGLLRGRAKSKRFVGVESVAVARSPAIVALVRAAESLASLGARRASREA